MHKNTAIAIATSSIFLSLGIAAASGASDNAIGGIVALGFFAVLGLVARLGDAG